LNGTVRLSDCLKEIGNTHPGKLFKLSHLEEAKVVARFLVRVGVRTSTGRETQKSFYTNAVGAKQVGTSLVNLQLHKINVGLVFCYHGCSVELARSLRDR
jgi:hypothetical protein